MTSAMSAAISPMQVPLGVGGSAALVALAMWRRRFGSAITRCRSAVLGVAVVLSLLILFGADLPGMRTVAYTRLWSDPGDSKRGGSDINAADQSAVRLLRQDVVEAYLALAAVGALKREGYATFVGAKEGVQKSNFVVFCETE